MEQSGNENLRAEVRQAAVLLGKEFCNLILLEAEGSVLLSFSRHRQKTLACPPETPAESQYFFSPFPLPRVALWFVYGPCRPNDLLVFAGAC